MDIYGAAMAVDEPEDEDAYFEGLQMLIDSGMAWQLQGRVGRAAMDAIDSGRCLLGVEGHTDYYGNHIPSRTEVQPGTKGSVEYALGRAT